MKLICKQIVLAILIATSLSNCKEKQCPVEEKGFAGTFVMEIQVKKRSPIINYDFGRPDVIPYDHQIIHNEVMDTTQEVCCRRTIKDTCYDSYILSGNELRIFEHNGQFYFKNGLLQDADRNQITFDIPLIERNDSMIYEKRIGPSIGYFSRPNNNGKVHSTAGVYPSQFDLLYLAIDKATHRGRWIIKDFENSHCFVTLSDGESYSYRMGEFAKFSLYRVK